MEVEASLESVLSEGGEVLLHSCCAPCSAAILEWMLANGLRPTIFFFNPNIFPRAEYDIRAAESRRHAESLGLNWIDGGYDHEAWLHAVRGLEQEPERGGRCAVCFRMRMAAAARAAKQLGIPLFTTSLASSRWKRIDQIEVAGAKAQEEEGGVQFWARNWRKGGLTERRAELLRQYGFYNQRYCGCEFSMNR